MTNTLRINSHLTSFLTQNHGKVPYPKIMGSANGYLAYSVENECLWDGPAISQEQVKCSPYGITTFSNTNQLQGQEKLREVSTLNIYRSF